MRDKPSACFLEPLALPTKGRASARLTVGTVHAVLLLTTKVTLEGGTAAFIPGKDAHWTQVQHPDMTTQHWPLRVVPPGLCCGRGDQEDNSGHTQRLSAPTEERCLTPPMGKSQMQLLKLEIQSLFAVDTL